MVVALHDVVDVGLACDGNERPNSFVWNVGIAIVTQVIACFTTKAIDGETVSFGCNGKEQTRNVYGSMRIPIGTAHKELLRGHIVEIEFACTGFGTLVNVGHLVGSNNLTSHAQVYKSRLHVGIGRGGFGHLLGLYRGCIQLCVVVLIDVFANFSRFYQSRIAL